MRTGQQGYSNEILCMVSVDYIINAQIQCDPRYNISEIILNKT